MLIREQRKVWRCTVCGEIKKKSDFGLNSKISGRGIPLRRSKCRQCFTRITREYQRQYRIDHPEKVKAAIDKHQKANRVKCSERGRLWRLENPEKYRVIAKECHRRRWLRPEVRLNSRIASALRSSLKGYRSHRTWEVLGYSVEDLKRRLESLFTDGMSWSNMGKWHIDHIIPQSFFVFDSCDDVEFKMCWRLENLQPLWAVDNLRKSAKLPTSPIAH